MRLPEDVRALLVRFMERYPLPRCEGCPVAARENAVRQWMFMFVEQVCFTLPGRGWGTKRADPGRPISADTITQRTVILGGESLLSWDLVVSAGDPEQRLNLDAESIVTTGQTFVEVIGVDHLGAPTPPPPPPPPVDPTPDPNFNLVLQRLDSLEAQLDRLQAALDTHARESLSRDGYIQQQLAMMREAFIAFARQEFEGQAKAWWGTIKFSLKMKPS